MARALRAVRGMRPMSGASMERTLVRLLQANSEAEVDAVIADTPEMGVTGNWVPLDGRETNWNVANNQSASGAKAATELITNMVDAILLRAATERGLDPRSADAPRTMHAAVEELLGWRGGRMMEAMPGKRERTAWAQQNLVVAFGGIDNEPGQPALTFCDTGEGQHPDDFERTFLSLSSGTKALIPFVQGKFNMGSSGVISYCGNRKYKLIVSRKHTKDGSWGYTLLRQRPGSDLPIIDYFKPGGAEKGTIPRFEAETLMPLYTRDGKPFEGFRLEFGTTVKLYDFQIGAEYQDYNATRRVFSEHLADTLMPIRILDLRVKPSKGKGAMRALGIDGRTFCGLEHHLSTGGTQEDGIEDEVGAATGARVVDVGEHVDEELGRISIRGYYTYDTITGKSNGADGRGHIRSLNRVFHTVNGQVQHRESRGVLSECGLPALKDHLVLVIDASHLRQKAHFEVWKADRETIRGNRVSDRYMKAIRDMVRSSGELAALNEETYARTINNAADASVKTVFQRLVDTDPTLARLMTGNVPMLAAARGIGGDIRRPRVREPFLGTYSPEFLTLSCGASGIELPRGGSAVLEARTTVGDDYFTRPVNPGEIEMSESLRVLGVVLKRTSLSGGRMMLFLSAPEDTPLGEVEAAFHLHDASMKGARAEARCLVRIVESIPEPERKSEPPRNRDPKQNHLSPPNLVLVTRDGRELNGVETQPWEEGWNEFDGGMSSTSGSNIKTVVNFDNAYLQEHLGRTREADREVTWTKYLLAMQVSMLGLERRIVQVADTPERLVDDEADRVRRTMAAGFASVALTIVDQMPKVMTERLGAMLLEE